MKLFIILLIITAFASLYAYSKSHLLNSLLANKLDIIRASERCTRINPYDNPPELMKAFSLASERWNNIVNSGGIESSLVNCIHLIYKDPSEIDTTEGYAAFDRSSTPNDVRIFVDSRYKDDDLILASLMAHQGLHAVYYLMSLEGIKPPSCVENEVNGYSTQLGFLVNLDPQDLKSLSYNVTQDPHLNSSYEITNHLLELNQSAKNSCGLNDDCYNYYIAKELKNWVKSNPYYKTQCHL